ncbi:hypothetical protein FHS14_001952 [Paenibacillus baekrokdamisoli]|nr:hypothetical protein [Paenibacillus baekrokdamisoli]MBB3068965.1 hypothetical protein [Paenibacillus baekrokdamisoli]
MKRVEVDLLDDMSLQSACFGPLIQAYKEIRTRGDDEIKFYNELTNGQQALFMFRAFYEHARKSAEDLYWWSAYFMAQTGRWPSLKRGLSYFEDVVAVTLIEDIERFLKERNHPRSLENFDVTIQDLENDSELLSSFEIFYARYQAVTPITIKRIGQYIREHADEFLALL